MTCKTRQTDMVIHNILKLKNIPNRIFEIYLPVLISLTFFLASGMGSMSSTDLIRAPRRPSLSSAERGRAEYQGSAKACPASWSMTSAGSGFGDCQRNHGATTDTNRISKRVARTSSTAQSILGKVRNRFLQFYWPHTGNQCCWNTSILERSASSTVRNIS